MGELGSKPEELYGKHKESAAELGTAQKRAAAAGELKDIVEQTKAKQLQDKAETAHDKYHGNIARAKEHYQTNKEAYQEQARQEMSLAEAQKKINAYEGRGTLVLNGLTSAEGLELPQEVEYLDLNGLSDEEKDKLRQRYPNLADKIK